MTKLYNVETGLEESLPLDQIPTAIQSGTHAYKKGTKLNVLDQDNESYSVDAEELPTVFSEGYRLESPDEQAVREYVKENQGIKGALKVGVGQFIDEAAMGIPELILDKTQDPLEVAKREALKKEQGLANTIGGVAGFGASFFTGAPLFKAGEAAGKAVASKLATITGSKIGEKAATGIAKNAINKAVEMGVEGTVIAAPTAITESMLGDPNAAAESLVIGGVLGGALGGSIGALKPLAKLGKEKLQYVTNAKKVETDAAYNLIGATPAARAKIPPDVDDKLPQFLKDVTAGDRSILTNPEKLARRIEEVEISSGKKLDDVITTLDDRVKQVAKESPEAAQELKASMFNYDDLINKIEDKYIKPYIDDPRYNAQVQKVQTELSSIKSLIDNKLAGDPNPIDLRSLRQFQQDSKNLINYDKKNMISDLATDARKEIVSDIQNYFKSGVGDKIKETFPDLASLANQFQSANDAYRMAVNITPIIDKAAAKADTKQLVSFGDLVLGGLGYGAGDLTGAATAVIGRKAIQGLNKQYDKAGLLYAEQIMKKTAFALDEIPKKLKNIEKPIRAKLTIGLSETSNNKEDDYDSISNKILDASMNPEKLESFYADTVDVLADQGAPQIAEATKVQTAEAIAYLANLVPKPLVPQNPLVKSKGFKPSSAEKNKFMRQAKAALDPLSVVDDVVNGSVTKDQLQVVADLYPDIYFRIQNKVLEAVQENPAEIPYNKRLKLSLLLNMNLDPSISPELLPILTNIQKVEQPNQQKPSNNIDFTTYPTDTQRIASK